VTEIYNDNICRKPAWVFVFGRLSLSHLRVQCNSWEGCSIY